MASQYRRLLDVRKLTANLTQPREQVWDAGAYAHLELHCRVLVAGSAGTVVVQHAAVNEEDAFRDLASFALSGGTPGGYTSTDHFLRYLRWRTDGAVAGDPSALIDVMAKE